jgi:hypothetical protein
LIVFARVVSQRKADLYLPFLYAAWDGQTIIYIMNLLTTTTTIKIIFRPILILTANMPIIKVTQSNYDTDYTNKHKQHKQIIIIISNAKNKHII